MSAVRSHKIFQYFEFRSLGGIISTVLHLKSILHATIWRGSKNVGNDTCKNLILFSQIIIPINIVFVFGGAVTENKKKKDGVDFLHGTKIKKKVWANPDL